MTVPARLRRLLATLPIPPEIKQDNLEPILDEDVLGSFLGSFHGLLLL